MSVLTEDGYPTHPLNDRLAETAGEWRTFDGVAPSSLVGLVVGILRSAAPGELAGWLEHHKLLRPADLWAVPDPDVELERLRDRVVSAAENLAVPETELDALLDEEGRLREAFDRTSPVYEEHEARPQCAPELYTVEVGERG